ncbi:Cdc37 N terminal kinase binding domain-containing protein [Trichoderma austrokoningii]
MVDYSKWDKLELSDDSDVDVHPNVDKRSFIKAKQNQIHVERQQRKVQIEALKYERLVNDTLWQRISSLISTLKATDDHYTPGEDAGDRIFRAVLEIAARDPARDQPPPPPQNVFTEDQPLPTSSKMILSLLDDVKAKIDSSNVEPEKRFDAIIDELEAHVGKIQTMQADLATKLSEFEKEGRDNANPVSAGTEVELLNPGFADDKLNVDREILRESDTDGLLIDAFNVAIDENNDEKTWQYVHQALLLQYCRMLGHDGTNLFFKPKDMFTAEVKEKFERIRELAGKQRSAESQKDHQVEQIQIMAVEPGTSIQIRIPDANSNEEDEKHARAVYEGFPLKVQEALQSGPLGRVNQVLAEMDVAEAEILVAQLREAGCLDIQEDVIDTTTDDGSKYLEDLEASFKNTSIEDDTP